MRAVKFWLGTRWRSLDLFFRVLVPTTAALAVVLLIGQEWLAGLGGLATAFVLADWQYWQAEAVRQRAYATLGLCVAERLAEVELAGGGMVTVRSGDSSGVVEP